MSNQNPYTTMFDMQRTLYNQQKQFVTRSFEMQRRMAESMHSGFSFGQSAEIQMRNLTEAMVDATIDAIEGSTPGTEPTMDDLRSLVEEQFDANEKLSEETWSVIESQFDEAMETYDRMLDESEDMYLDLFESYVNALENVETTVDEAA